MSRGSNLRDARFYSILFNVDTLKFLNEISGSTIYIYIGGTGLLVTGSLSRQ